MGDRCKALVEWAEAREPTAPTIASELSCVPWPDRLGQHMHARLLMSLDSGTEAHSTVDNAPGENGLEA